MKLRQLEAFIAACELGTISRAAEKLFIAQPALGLQIRGLEDDMGVQLLERTTRGVTPTPAGKEVLAWARDMIRSKAELKGRLRLLSSGISNHVRLGLSPSLAVAFAVPILERAREQFPNLRLDLTEALGQFLVDQIQNAQVDMALVFEEVGGVPKDDKRVLYERLCFVTARENAHSTAPEITLADVLEHPLALPSLKDSLRHVVQRGADSLGLPAQIKYEVQSSAVVLSLVRSGIASSVLPMSMAMEGVRDGALSVQLIREPVLTRSLRWLRSPSLPNEPYVTQLQALIESTLRECILAGPLQSVYSFGSPD
jgi:LysR family nitrogen assimilation transcriptional regulator